MKKQQILKEQLLRKANAPKGRAEKAVFQKKKVQFGKDALKRAKQILKGKF